MSPTQNASLSLSAVGATGVIAFVLTTLALLFFGLARRDREPGMPWLGAGFGLAALWYVFSPELVMPLVLHLTTPALRLSSGVLTAATMCTTLGVIVYLRGSIAANRGWIALLVPCAALLAGLALGLDVTNAASALARMLCFAATGVLALRQSRVEPGAGHVLLGISLLLVPTAVLVLQVLRVAPGALPVLAAMPMIFFGMTLLTVSLLRRRRALEAEIARRAAAEAALGAANQGFNRAVSHDLRGPLGGIAGLAQLATSALDGGDVAMVRRSLAAIATQADTSTKLVAALLQLAHVGDAKLARRKVALEALTRDVIAQLRLGQDASGMAASAQWIVGALPDVEADADLLRPVLVNLMTNALKFSRDAHPPIVRIDASIDARETTVHVRDNGVGFAPDSAERLFQPFMRLHGRRFEGHGIGLSIVRRAVERHGGRVWADGEPDHGAAFHFTLPHAA
jgi:signal transduction histidine kinase